MRRCLEALYQKTVFSALLLLVVLVGSASAQIDESLLHGMKPRLIGPAAMSGRVTSIEAVIDDPQTIYVGAATGGVWKSTDGGVNWKPIFDDQPVHSIGALAINQANPDIVWVGTGEGNPRNSISVGNGIYKTIDGGETWEHLGLEGSEHIHRVVLHPTDPHTPYHAARGPAGGENEERGVFKTTDGGRSWEKILYVDERTGATELVMDPANPDHLIAGMWEFRRWPFFFKSGGPGSGMYVTWDGGDTWQQITAAEGLPKGELGRMGVAFSRSDPEIAYALVEAEKSALLRSDDGGQSWHNVNTATDVAQRPFYFGEIRVDPKDPDTVYNVAGIVQVSIDAGKSFKPLIPFAGIHGDHHTFWIHPDDADFMLDGNDGGAALSHDHGATWEFVRGLPLAQFYHIGVDMAVPYNVYGGLQDNGSWRGPSAVWEGFFGPFGGGIRSFHWQMLDFGDGFDTQVVPGDSEVGYAMAQGGELVRWDLASGQVKSIQPPPRQIGPGEQAPDDAVAGFEPLRFNWNAGLAVDPFDPNTIYYGSQYLHKSTDRGDTWAIISPDLTTDNAEWQQQAESGGLTVDVTAAENYTTIIAIAPSPVQQGTIWVGTDDGRLQVSRDAGASWTSVEANLKGVPANTWIPHVKASKFDAASAFVVLDNHRRSDWTPYIFRTEDYGAHWRSLVTDKIRGYALSIEQDPVDPNLLFLGTEFALYFSTDGGNSWTQWTEGLPTASYMDLVVHPRDHDLVIATHGRGIFIVDDIRPLRGLNADLLAEPLHLFEIPATYQYSSLSPPGGLFAGAGEFVGENKARGAMITYAVGIEPEEGEAKAAGEPGAGAGIPAFLQGIPGAPQPPEGPQLDIKISDGNGNGNNLRTFKGPAQKGINRAVWNFRRDGFKQAPGGGGGFFAFFGNQGPEVPPGTYNVTISYQGHEATGTVTIEPDPRSSIVAADRQAKWEAIRKVGHLQETAAEAVTRIVDSRGDIDTILKKSGGGQMPGMGGDLAAMMAARGGGERQAAPEGEQAAAAEGGSGEPPSPKAQLMKAGPGLKKKLDELEKRLRTPPGTKGIPAADNSLARIQNALGRLTSSWEAPSSADQDFIRQAEADLSAILDDLNQLFVEDVASFRRLVQEAGIELLPEKEPLRIEQR
ncbi:MAG: WD40/YVTN/BNR-like repeat-containing protein [Acidobacteriota bacterium]